MSELKGFCTPPIKVSEMRQLIHSGQFAAWVKAVRAASARLLSVAVLNDNFVRLARPHIQGEIKVGGNKNDKKVIDTN